MRVLELKTMRGPNYWSEIHSKIIVLKIDLEELGREATNHLPGFAERLKQMLPSLYNHRCTEGEKGGFYKVLDQGTFLGHVIEHVALELQNLAGMDCNFGKTLSLALQGQYQVIFEYNFEAAGRLAGEQAVDLVRALALNQEFALNAAVTKLKEIAEVNRFDGDTHALVHEASQRRIPYNWNKSQQILQLGFGNRSRLMRGTLTNHCGAVGLQLCQDQEIALDVLEDAGLPVGGLKAKEGLSAFRFTLVDNRFVAACQVMHPAGTGSAGMEGGLAVQFEYEDVTDLVDDGLVAILERAARILQLDVCAFFAMAEDVNDSDKEFYITRVEAAPAISPHHHPVKGLPRNVAGSIIDMLFRDAGDGRIPLVAVTGTNGKTTTTRLIAHLARYAGKHRVGFTSTEGVYVDGQRIQEGDCTGPVSAQTILSDPLVDFAVLECARGGILRSGLGFDQCDIGIVTNVTADHLNLKDITSLEEMARVKLVVPLSVRASGHVILNAEDDLVYAMRDRVQCKIALFSLDPQNPRVIEHCAEGGLAAFIEEGFLTVSHGTWKTRIERVEDLPMTLRGRADSMIKNLLPATLAAIIQNFDLEKVRQALRSFVLSPETTPGRMNVFRFPDFQVMVDYAHNVDGMLNLRQFIESSPAGHKVGIIGAGGDRRDEDLKEIGRIVGAAFDEIIIRHDADLRGRSKEEMNALFTTGIREVKPHIKISVISDPLQAIDHAIQHARPGTFIVATTNDIFPAIDLLREHQARLGIKQKGHLRT